MLHLDSRPIVACSSATGRNAALSVIRISGFQSLDLFTPFLSSSVLKLSSRVAKLMHLEDGQGNHLDDVVVLFFAGPKSFTGENILEISAHGNQLNVQRILDALCASDKMRIAYPGEFSYRALINQKLSLAQIEGLDLFLNANSRSTLDFGSKLMSGEVAQTYGRLRKSSDEMAVAIELLIDFSEDVSEEASLLRLNSSFQEFSLQFASLLRRCSGNLAEITSPDIILAGAPNSGKSTLFNLLLSRNRSIVSPVAGTTRDYISEYILLDYYQFNLIDTAGIRPTTDQIEQAGIHRTQDLLSKAFFKILLINPLDQNFKADLSSESFDLVLYTHADHPAFCVDPQASAGYAVNLSGSLTGGSIEPVACPINQAGPIEPLRDFLETAILKKYRAVIDENPISLERHRQLIRDLGPVVTELKATLEANEDIAILASLVTEIRRKLAELIGITPANDLLDSIFQNFCIGK